MTDGSTQAPNSPEAENLVLAQLETPGTGEMVLAQLETNQAATAGASADLVLLIPKPPAEERVEYLVSPGARVELADPAFDPSIAIYGPDGDDLVVRLADGGEIVLVDFFASGAGGETSTLAVGAAPPVLASALLDRSEYTAPVEASGKGQSVQPAGGPNDDGGGAGFSPFAVDSLGAGLDPLGPLGPTSLAFEPPDRDETIPFTPGGAGDEDTPVDPPEVSNGPRLHVVGELDGFIAEVGKGRRYESGKLLPELKEGVSLPDSKLVAQDPDHFTADKARQLYVRFEGDGAGLRNSVGYYKIAEDGAIGDATVIFPNVDARDQGGPLRPNVDVVDLGVIKPDERVGFFLIQDGFDRIPSQFLDEGSLRFERPNSSETANVNDLFTRQDPTATPRLIHVGDDGVETDLSAAFDVQVFHQDDESLQTAQLNRLNPDLDNQSTFGFDPDLPGSFFTFEDLNGRTPDYLNARVPGLVDDNDLNDAIFSLQWAPVYYQQEFNQSLALTITHEDNLALDRAVVELTGTQQSADRISGLPELGEDNTIVGTDIRVTTLEKTVLVFEGEADLATYQEILDGLFVTTAPSIANPGERTLTLQVRDVEGNESEVADVSLDVRPLIAGGDGFDTLVGTGEADGISGRGGDDLIEGGGGFDILDGGMFRDTINGGPGNDLIIGGHDKDRLTGGSGADTFAYLSLDDRKDKIFDFDAQNGDRLDVSCLFKHDFDYHRSDLSDFIRLIAKDVDQDGKIDDVEVRVDLDGDGHKFGEVNLANLVDAKGVIPEGTDSRTQLSDDVARSILTQDARLESIVQSENLVAVDH